MPRKPQSPTGDITDRVSAFNAIRLQYTDINDPLTIEPVSEEDVLPTPSPSINNLCGTDRGIRKGSIVHCYGPYGSLKTTLALQMIKQAQEKWPDKSTAYIDTEYRVDLYQASENIGINFEPFDDGTPRVIYRRPESAEDVWELIKALAASSQFSIIVLDSATAMRSRTSLEKKEFTTGVVGDAARSNSGALKLYAPLFPNTGTILWAINQERITSITPIVTKGPTGGNAWQFYSTHEFKIEKVTREREEESQAIDVFSHKMKWALGYKSVTVPVILGKGIDTEGDIVNCAIEAGLLNKSGSWIQIGTEKVQGLEKAKQYLTTNPEIKEQLVSALNELHETG